MIEQPTLFDLPRRETEQDRELKRVKGSIGRTVLQFVREIGVGREFRGEQLRRYVSERHPGAPASPDRILRQLRLDHHCDYEIANRRGSLYRFTAVS